MRSMKEVFEAMKKRDKNRPLGVTFAMVGDDTPPLSPTAPTEPTEPANIRIDEHQQKAHEPEPAYTQAKKAI